MNKVFSLLIAFTLVSCSMKPNSRGDAGQFVVVADPLDRPIIQAAINNSLGRIVHTPQPEPAFNIKWIRHEELKDWTRSPLIMMAASMNNQSNTIEYINKMLSDEVKEGVNTGSYEIFRRSDPWARNQKFILLLGRNPRELGARAVKWSDSLYNWSLDTEYTRLTNELRKTAEKFDYDDDTGSFRFSFFKQPDYIMTQENDELKFIRFIRHYPERWIMLAWGKLLEDETFDGNYLYNRRKQYGREFLDKVTTYDDHWSLEDSRINNISCLKIRGLWASDGPAGGGPFFTYGIQIDDEGHFLIVDGSVFAPGENKVQYLWQIEAMAQSVEINSLNKGL